MICMHIEVWDALLNNTKEIQRVRVYVCECAGHLHKKHTILENHSL